MKGRSLGLCVAMAVILLLNAFSATAAVRTVLLEGFTQWNCGPCANWNPQERQILEAFTRDTVVSIKYHGWWPGSNNDAFHLWNVAENTARINFYLCNWVPWVETNGTYNDSLVNATTIRNHIRTRRAMAAPCTIQMSANAMGARSVHVTGTITATDSAITGANEKLFLALITDQIHYASPPGTNGETFFPDVFRDMWPNTSGQAISIPMNGTYDIDATLNKDSLWSPDSLSVIAFVQNYTTHWIHQAAWTHVLNLWQVNATSTDPVQLIADVNGGDVVYTIHLANGGRNNDTYTVSLGGTAPAGWTRSISATDVPEDPNSIEVPLNSNQTTDVTVRYNPNGHAGSTTVTVDIQSQGNSATHDSKAFRLMAGLDILLADDDGGVNNFQSYYVNALQAAEPNRVSGWWDLSLGTLDENLLPNIPLIIWMTGSSPTSNTLSAIEQSMLETYLNNGGKLFLSGQGIAFDLRNSSFLSDVLHTAHVAPFPAGQNVVGVAGNPVSDGLNYPVFGGDGASNQTRQNKIRPLDASASVLWNWQGQGGDTCAAVQIQTPVYRTVFMAYGFEAIDNAAHRNAVMGRVVDWLLGSSAADPRTTLNPSEFALGQNYPNPFNPETVIPYALPVRAEVSLRVFDILGREVAELASGIQEPGVHAVTWNAATASSGLYFYRLDVKAGAKEFHATRKLMLLK